METPYLKMTDPPSDKTITHTINDVELICGMSILLSDGTILPIEDYRTSEKLYKNIDKAIKEYDERRKNEEVGSSDACSIEDLRKSDSI